MCNRAIETALKVKALEQCLTLQNVEQVAAEVGVAPNSIRNWFHDKVLPALPAILVNEAPGPKPSAPPVMSAESPTAVAQAGPRAAEEASHPAVEKRRTREGGQRTVPTVISNRCGTQSAGRTGC